MRKYRAKFVRTIGEPPPLFSGVLSYRLLIRLVPFARFLDYYLVRTLAVRLLCLFSLSCMYLLACSL